MTGIISFLCILTILVLKQQQNLQELKLHTSHLCYAALRIQAQLNGVIVNSRPFEATSSICCLPDSFFCCHDGASDVH